MTYPHQLLISLRHIFEKSALLVNAGLRIEYRVICAVGDDAITGEPIEQESRPRKSWTTPVDQFSYPRLDVSHELQPISLS